MKLNDELQKLFRTVSLYVWSLNDDDIVNDTNMCAYYTNDLINYLSTGDASNVMTIANAEANDTEDVDYTKAKAMISNTIEIIDDFKEKLAEVENNANKKKSII